MSKKKRTSRGRHRKVRRNRYVLVRNARGALRRLARNVTIGGIDTIEKILFPALGATGGLLLSQWLGSKVAPSWFPGTDPRFLAAGASTVAAFGAYKAGEALGLAPDTQMAIAAGAGVAGFIPWVPPAMLPTISAAASPSAPNVATSGYYQRGMLSGLMIDVSHAGAPYKGMLGLGADPGDQSAVDDVLTSAERVQAVSTVEPIDMALPAIKKKAFRRVRETMGTPRDRGWAGGIYARNLFSGSMS